MLGFESKIKKLLSRIKCVCLEKEFNILFELDKIYNNRYYIQLEYNSKCNKRRKIQIIEKVEKWYLSEYMTEDEVVKTCYAAFQACINHENNGRIYSR